jgi:glycosyltransferase involved in cell wall biosynthesis
MRVRPEPGQESSLRFAGHVDDAELDDLYRRSRCVVAPAYREDYGLTAIEGMARGRPVIVCRDGGGLTEFVEDGVTGFVVDPTPAAIVEAIGRLDDDERAAQMGAAAREAAAAYTWDRALDEVEAALAVAVR